MGPYKCDPALYEAYYCARGGSKIYPYFKGEYIQRGYGNILSALTRAAIPLVKSLVKSPTVRAVGKDVLKTGGDVLRDVVSGERGVKQSVKRRGRDLVKRQLEALLNNRKNKKRRRIDILGN